MGNRLLNENFIRQRSEELQIPFENLLAASILEEIVQRIAESDCSACFWMKNSMNLKLEYYRKKVDLNLFFYIAKLCIICYNRIMAGKFKFPAIIL